MQEYKCYLFDDRFFTYFHVLQPSNILAMYTIFHKLINYISLRIYYPLEIFRSVKYIVSIELLYDGYVHVWCSIHRNKDYADDSRTK